jgi:hypothetical protein
LTICRITKFNSLILLWFGLIAKKWLIIILSKRRITDGLRWILISLVRFYLLLLIEEPPLNVLTVSRGSNNLMILKYYLVLNRACIDDSCSIRSIFFFNTPIFILDSLYNHRIKLVTFLEFIDR